MKHKKALLSSIVLFILSLVSCNNNLMYYNMSIDKGIEVYTHILNENKYEFGFMPGTNMLKKAEDVNKLIYVDVKEGKKIISSYGDRITENNLIIFIIPNPCTDADLKLVTNEEQK